MRDSCNPGGVSDGLRLAVYQTLFIECPSSIFYGMCFVIFLSFCCSRFVLFLLPCSRWSFIDVSVRVQYIDYTEPGVNHNLCSG